MKTCFVITAAFLCCLISTIAKPLEACNTLAGFPEKDSVGSDAKTREKFDPNRDAAKDIANAILLAQKEGKRILLDVGGEWCSWCHKLDKFFLDNKDVADFLSQHYVVVKVNFSKENKNEKVLSVYPPINGYPHLFVLENNGTLLHSQDTGELESGDHHDHDKVFNFLKKWASQSKM